MRYLVTGAAGFIGSHLCEHIIQTYPDAFVYGLDDGSGGRYANLKSLHGHQRFVFFPRRLDGGVDVYPEVQELDVVFHLAAAVGVKTAIERGVAVMEDNALATKNAIDIAEEYGARFVFTSSSEVYGHTHAMPLREDASIMLQPPTSQRWAYTCGKAADEYLTLGRPGLLGIVARLFNTVGARQNRNYGAVLPAFVEAALKGKPLVLHGGGHQTRSFIHVSDTVRGLCTLAEKGEVGEVYNVGIPDETTILDLARYVGDVLQKDITVETPPADSDLCGCPRRVPDATKLLALGWEPKRSVTAAILDLATEMGA